MSAVAENFEQAKQQLAQGTIDLDAHLQEQQEKLRESGSCSSVMSYHTDAITAYVDAM